MSNVGTTTIEVSGQVNELDRLRAGLASTATATLAFDPMLFRPGEAATDHQTFSTALSDAGSPLALSVWRYHDGDAVGLAGWLAARYPRLQFRTYFACEGTWPDFVVSSHAGGQEEYLTHFPIPFCAVIHDASGIGHHVRLYQRSPERDRAALEFSADSMQPFLDRQPCAHGWTRSDDAASGRCFMMDAVDERRCLLVLELPEFGDLLHDVDRSGGYRLAERLTVDQVRSRFPELGGELDRAQEESLHVTAVSSGWLPSGNEALSDKYAF